MSDGEIAYVIPPNIRGRIVVGDEVTVRERRERHLAKYGSTFRLVVLPLIPAMGVTMWIIGALALNALTST